MDSGTETIKKNKKLKEWGVKWKTKHMRNYNWRTKLEKKIL
jgi:hypothetical protein